MSQFELWKKLSVAAREVGHSAATLKTWGREGNFPVRYVQPKGRKRGTWTIEYYSLMVFLSGKNQQQEGAAEPNWDAVYN